MKVVVHVILDEGDSVAVDTLNGLKKVIADNLAGEDNVHFLVKTNLKLRNK